ncbi:MAG TPA: DUF1553 domain-containing protein [Chthoniobacter sp.]
MIRPPSRSTRAPFFFTLRRPTWSMAALTAVSAAGLFAGALSKAAELPKDPASRDLWSLKPVTRPEVPKVKETKAVRNPLDAFVLAKLEEKGLTLSPEADRLTLIRRLSFDLIGLPPTPEEVDAFVKDKSKDAYEKLVDRLLASPHYGERWGRHWLDIVHYGDTHGFDRDKRRPHEWPYRDYVIKSFNEDKPYSRFVQEQLAGDVLFPGNTDALIGTGFITAGPWDFESQMELREGTVEREKAREIDRNDMIIQTMGTFASLTVHCARCHDHKFDPIPQKDYYRLDAVFSGIERKDRIYADAAAEKRATLVKRLAEIAQTLPAGWSSAIAPKEDTAKWVQIDLGKSVPLTEIRLVAARPIDSEKDGFGFPLRFTVAVSDDATFAKSDMLVDHTLVDFPNPGATTVKIPATGKTARYVRVASPLLYKKSNDSYLMAFGEIEVESEGQNVAFGAPVTASDSLEAPSWSPKFLTDGFDGRLWLRFPDDYDVRDHAVKAVDEYTSLAKQLAALPEPKEFYGFESIPARKISVLKRGDVTKPIEEVTAGAPSCVEGIHVEFPTGPENEGKRRAALAEWITDAKNPLTRRSIVNRVWQYHFGRGIVATPSDFGRNGIAPTNLELLDYLATEFVKDGESIKKLTRLIVSSATYKQSSANNEKAEAIDADNLLLWRQNRARLEAEEVRDSVLAVSGKLDPKMGGPAYEPFHFVDDKSPVYDHLDIASINNPVNWRRAVYRFAVRSVPDPFLECLDCADPSINTPVRTSTITALQSLAMLNDPFMLKQSENFAERLGKMAKSPAEQVRAGFRLAFGRVPTAAETSALVPVIDKEGLPTFCRVLFNTNEFFFVD